MLLLCHSLQPLNRTPSSLSLGVIWALMLAMKLLVLWTVVCPQLVFLQKQLHRTTQNRPQSSQVRKPNHFPWKSVEKHWSTLSWTGVSVVALGNCQWKPLFMLCFKINQTRSPHSFSGLRAGKLRYPGQSIDSDIVSNCPRLWREASSTTLLCSLSLGNRMTCMVKTAWTIFLLPASPKN